MEDCLSRLRSCVRVCSWHDFIAPEVPTASDELTQIKNALAAFNEREAATRRGRPRADLRPAPAQDELAQLQSLLAANPDLGKLAEILRRRRGARRKGLLTLQEHMRSEAQRSQAAAAASVAAGIRARRHALSLLAQPFTASYVTLDEPFLIWELPHPELNIFRDSNIESFGSWVKILLETNSSPGGFQKTDFRFYFLWENPTDHYAVANVSSSFSVNGQAVAWGGGGILIGDMAILDVTAYLSAVRWSGWADNDETQYPIFDQSANKNVVHLVAWGGSWFEDDHPDSATFDPQTAYDVRAQMIAIPGRAVTLFEVGLRVEWSFFNLTASGEDPVDDFGQSITLDLAYDPPAYMARCPMVELEILTPQSQAQA